MCREEGEKKLKQSRFEGGGQNAWSAQHSPTCEQQTQLRLQRQTKRLKAVLICALTLTSLESEFRSGCILRSPCSKTTWKNIFIEHAHIFAVAILVSACGEMQGKAAKCIYVGVPENRAYT